MTLSLQLLWNYWSIYHETWYVDRRSYGVMHIGRKFWSPHFCGSYAPWNLENIRKSTNNLTFLCQFFINEITASDAGPDIIRSHLFKFTNIIPFSFLRIFIISITLRVECWDNLILIKCIKLSSYNAAILYHCLFFLILLGCLIC